MVERKSAVCISGTQGLYFRDARVGFSGEVGLLEGGDREIKEGWDRGNREGYGGKRRKEVEMKLKKEIP